jgi:hypothetical protein
MPNKPHKPMIYQIKLEGHLGQGWSGWFGDMTIHLEDGGDTVLTGRVIDQAALYGLIRKVRDLGLPLISVIRVETNRHKRSRTDHKKEKKQ